MCAAHIDIECLILIDLAARTASESQPYDRKRGTCVPYLAPVDIRLKFRNVNSPDARESTLVIEVACPSVDKVPTIDPAAFFKVVLDSVPLNPAGICRMYGKPTG